MDNVSRFLTLILIVSSFCFSKSSLLAMTEEDAPPKTPRALATAAGGNNVHEEMMRLSSISLLPPAILNERLLSTPEQHVDFLKAVLRTAYERVIIVSPYISVWRLKEEDKDGFYKDIEEATRRGVKVTVFTDGAFDEGKPNAIEGRKHLVKARVDLRIVNRIHSKNLIVDDNLITFGSFNWLSAVINPASEFCRYETSTLMKDDYAPIAIQRILGELNTIPIRDTEGYHAFYVECEPGESDFRAAIRLYKRYASHPLYKAATQELMSSHSDSGLREGLSIIKALQETGTSADILIGRIKSLPEFQIGDAEDFLVILEVLATISPLEAMNAATDQNKGLLTRINRGADYENLDHIYSVLSRMGMQDLANRVEGYVLTGL